ncbi:MAG: hypothetical protein ABIL58_06670 [Pseudomonadota bacterium]
MIPHSVPVVAMAAISGFVGILFIFIYIRYPSDKTNGSFALVCFASVVYDIGCVGLYNSIDFSTSAEWQRLQFMSIALLTITLSFFYHNLTGKLSLRTLIIITSINIGFIIAGYTIKSHLTLSPEYTAEKFIVLGEILNIHILESRPGVIYNIQTIFSLIIFTTLIVGLIKFQRSSSHGKTPVVVAMAVLYCATINDVLVDMGIVSFLYLFEYAFSALNISMALILINAFLNIHGKVEKMNLLLEKTVKEKTQELKIISGLLPICSTCKKIRDDKGYWNHIESYIHKHSDVVFSHGICPECAKKYYPDMDLYGDEKT